MKKKLLHQLVLTGMLALFSQLAYSGSELQTVPTIDSESVAQLKTAVAWGMVPLGSEMAINGIELMLKGYKHPLTSFTNKLLSVHKKNVSRATSQHLTDNLSARLENTSYKLLSDVHLTNKTAIMQSDLLDHSLATFSVLSKHAQKARKTFFRLLDTIDTVSSSASVALARGDPERAAALMAFSAQLLVYIQPEYQPDDVFDSVHLHFSKHLDLNIYPKFRQRIMKHLTFMDPLSQRSALMRLRYCDILNVWKIDPGDCSQQEAHALIELEKFAVSMSGSDAEAQGFIKTMLSGFAPNQIRNGIFALGVLVPGIILYLVDKRPWYIDGLARHFAKVVGLATTKENVERLASQSRRALENWGAINTGMQISRDSGQADFTNAYFSLLQKKAGMILAEQPNFARSNVQRALESMVIHLSDAYQAVAESPDSAASILAGALVHNYREMVELHSEDTTTRALILAYRPLADPSFAEKVQTNLDALDPEYRNSTDVQKGYKWLLLEWEKLSMEGAVAELDDVPDPAHENAVAGSDCSPEECQKHDLMIPEGSSTAVALYEPLPDKETIKETMATTTMHTAALGVGLLSAWIYPPAISKLVFSGFGQTFSTLGSYYLLLSMIDFGLRSIGEPAIMHLQTLVKSLIGSTPGILEPEDASIQSELSSKVNELNRKLSIEGQTSRSYKMTLEALFAKLWTLSVDLSADEEEDYSASASVLAYAAYIFRYYHPEFEVTDLVMGALARARLARLLNKLEAKGLMVNYEVLVDIHLVQLDPDYLNKTIKMRYRGILSTWGIDSGITEIEHFEDVLNSWAVYADWLLGGIGFAVQSGAKALMHTLGLAMANTAAYIRGDYLALAAVYAEKLLLRPAVNFAASVFEYGTTDPLRNRIYAFSRQQMLNLLHAVSFYDTPEQLSADYANNGLTASFRRQKFFLGKPELDMRTQLVQIITSMATAFSEARLLLADHQVDRATDQIALSLARITLYAPDLPDDDSHLTNALQSLSVGLGDELVELQPEILGKVGELLKNNTSLATELQTAGVEKSRKMLQLCASY